MADTDEHGNVREGTASARYNWLAAHQRDADTPSGVILMGVRQYDPSTGHADRLSEAEEKAATALVGRPLPASWRGADPALRRRFVAACRPVPTAGLWHVADDRPDTDEARARRDCLRALADEWPEAEPLPADQGDRLPGLTALLRLTALVCRMPPTSG
ncbi:hypothetical protein [Streptomyces sp. NPDC018833]|uniref:hypothetical protein n=1 Tax=Streptomyces sp. NPDC018833 TaxID=3365053 RepID=UPI00379200D7